MAEPVCDEYQIAPPSVVRQAARDFATALSETPQFRNYESATQRLRHDKAAQRLMSQYDVKQASLRMDQMLGAVSAADQTEMDRLERAFRAEPTIAAYLQAHADLAVLCGAAIDQLSKHIGLSFASACGPGCC